MKVEGDDEVARLAESFNRAAARIEELVGAHKALLANASHELRTPLARIRMTVELMKENADPKRKRDLEQDIAELDALIDEILLASRLSGAAEQTHDEDVDLLALATEECARYEEARARRAAGHRSRRPAPAPPHDPESPRERPPPRRAARSRSASAATGTRAEISVCDHGPGVPEAEREAVFLPFHRFAGDSDRAGSGLGLALVRQIARRHGGDARCEARQDSGSCFVVTLGASLSAPCPDRPDARAPGA